MYSSVDNNSTILRASGIQVFGGPGASVIWGSLFLKKKKKKDKIGLRALEGTQASGEP